MKMVKFAGWVYFSLLLGGTAMAADMPATKHIDSIVVGAGCFWGVEKRFEAMPGVIDAVSGYADGNGVEPTYRAITQSRNKHNPDNHAEVVKVSFNPAQISLDTLLKRYFEMHDPTQLNRQGNDIGTQYRSIILTNSTAQADIAQQLQQVGMARGLGQRMPYLIDLDKGFGHGEGRVGSGRSNAQIRAPDFFVGGQFLHARLVADLAFFKHIGPVRHQLGKVHVLLGQQDAHTLGLERQNHLHHLLHDDRRHAF